MCNHSPPLEVSIDVEELYVRTPTAEVGRTACVDCLEDYAYFVDDLPWRHSTRHGVFLYPRESAAEYVMKCISSGPTPTWQKFKAIKWCIRWGWRPCPQVYDFVNWTNKQTRWLAIHGCIPSLDNIEEMVRQQKFSQLKMILRYMPEETFNKTFRFLQSTARIRELIHSVIEPREILAEVLGVNQDLPNLIMQFVEK